MASPKRLAQGHHLEGSQNISLTISLPPELFADIRKMAEEESRSFSNTIAILTRRALRTRDDHQQ